MIPLVGDHRPYQFFFFLVTSFTGEHSYFIWVSNQKNKDYFVDVDLLLSWGLQVNHNSVSFFFGSFLLFFFFFFSVKSGSHQLRFISLTGPIFSSSTNAIFPLNLTVSILSNIKCFGSFWIFLVKIRNPIDFTNELDSACDMLVVIHKPTFWDQHTFLSKGKIMHVSFGNKYIYSCSITEFLLLSDLLIKT